MAPQANATSRANKSVGRVRLSSGNQLSERCHSGAGQGRDLLCQSAMSYLLEPPVQTQLPGHLTLIQGTGEQVLRIGCQAFADAGRGKISVQGDTLGRDDDLTPADALAVGVIYKREGGQLSGL